MGRHTPSRGRSNSKNGRRLLSSDFSDFHLLLCVTVAVNLVGLVVSPSPGRKVRLSANPGA